MGGISRSLWNSLPQFSSAPRDSAAGNTRHFITMGFDANYVQLYIVRALMFVDLGVVENRDDIVAVRRLQEPFFDEQTQVQNLSKLPHTSQSRAYETTSKSEEGFDWNTNKPSWWMLSLHVQDCWLQWKRIGYSTHWLGRKLIDHPAIPVHPGRSHPIKDDGGGLGGRGPRRYTPPVSTTVLKSRANCIESTFILNLF